ncbi:hypothetical protein MTBLM5_20167 [Magnetospirillum sp. LM-5]|nr:hypothetical protein MTBLM5_20167 [Magnetospirillum sp. LM-5]
MSPPWTSISARRRKTSARFAFPPKRWPSGPTASRRCNWARMPTAPPPRWPRRRRNCRHPEKKSGGTGEPIPPSQGDKAVTVFRYDNTDFDARLFCIALGKKLSKTRPSSL